MDEATDCLIRGIYVFSVLQTVKLHKVSENENRKMHHTLASWCWEEKRERECRQ